MLLDIKGCDWARLGYPDRSYHDVRFEPWRNALHKHNVEAALHATDCPDLPLIGSKRARDSSATAGLHNPRRSRIEQPDQHHLQPPRDGVHGRLGPPIHHRYCPGKESTIELTRNTALHFSQLFVRLHSDCNCYQFLAIAIVV